METPQKDFFWIDALHGKSDAGFVLQRGQGVFETLGTTELQKKMHPRECYVNVPADPALAEAVRFFHKLCLQYDQFVALDKDKLRPFQAVLERLIEEGYLRLVFDGKKQGNSQDIVIMEPTKKMFSREFPVSVLAEKLRKKLLKVLNGLNGRMPPFVQKRRICALDSLLRQASHKNALEDTWGEEISVNGIALSPAMAANCVSDWRRTLAFSRGLSQAISAQLKRFPGRRPLRVLYAGTGPFAALALPSMERFSPEEVQFDLMDINTVSLKNVQRVLEICGFESFSHESIHGDATLFQTETKYDLIITETMGPALTAEPQLEIIQNTRHFLAEGGLLLPEEVSLGLVVVANGKIIMSAPELWSSRSQGNLLIQMEMTVRRSVSEIASVGVETCVHVFGGNGLSTGDSYITSALFVGKLPCLHEGEKIHISYDAGADLVYGTKKAKVEVVSGG